MVQRFLLSKNVEAYLDEEEETQPPKRSRYAFIMTLCGIHGTISLSMALTLPFIINGNQNFVVNDLLFIASMMVLISLIFAQNDISIHYAIRTTITLQGMSYQSAKILAIQHVIRTLKEKADTHKRY